MKMLRRRMCATPPPEHFAISFAERSKRRMRRLKIKLPQRTQLFVSIICLWADRESVNIFFDTDQFRLKPTVTATLLGQTLPDQFGIH
jgi:hypothetical protein